MEISDLVTDWGGFEKLVATLNETGEVTVQHNVTLPGRSGAPRQIDVLIRHKQGLYDHLVVAECKYWKEPVARLHVDALATTIREVGASRGVIFSTKGFQSGAIAQAKHDNIELFQVRDLTEKEWGLPGRVIDFYLQVLQPGIGNISCPGATGVGFFDKGSPLGFNFTFGTDGPTSVTPTLKRDGTLGGKSLEQYIFDGAMQSMENLLRKFHLINGGEECTRYVSCPTNLMPDIPITVPLGDKILFIPQISFELGLKVSQSRITHDRGGKYKFALAVESYVTGIVSAASRDSDSAITTLRETGAGDKREGEEPLLNGSLHRVILKTLFPFEETTDLEPIPMEPRIKLLRAAGEAGS